MAESDERDCEICDGNAAEDWIPAEDAFSSGDDYPLAHPACRCDAQYRADTFLNFENVEDADKWGKQAYENWINGLTEYEKDDVENYTSGFYRQINAELRGTTLDPGESYLFNKEELEDTIVNLTSALDKAKLPDNIIVWRGRGMTDEQIALLQVGDKIDDKGFYSTSLMKYNGIEYARLAELDGSYTGAKGVVFEIRARRGLKGAYINSISLHKKEYEMLFKDDSKLSIIDIKESDIEGLLHVIAELVYE